MNKITYSGQPMATSPTKFGEFKRSDSVREDIKELRRRMKEDGYLFLPGFLDRDDVRAARLSAAKRLAKAGYLADGSPLEECIAAPDGDPLPATATKEHLHIAKDNNQKIDQLIFNDLLIKFFDNFFGRKSLHVNSLSRFRTKFPKEIATSVHADSPYMGRGSNQLYSIWIPLGDNDFDQGGLMVLENSNTHEGLRSYRQDDSDTYCGNDKISRTLVNQALADGRDLKPDEHKQLKWATSSGNRCVFSHDANATCEKLGGRWLTTKYKMGDLLIFSIYTLHASTDNNSDKLRISCDTRYQPASEPIDERWIGPNPIRHNVRGYRCKTG